MGHSGLERDLEPVARKMMTHEQELASGTTVVNSYDEVPQFASETEEQAFWSCHTLSEELLTRMEPIPTDALPHPRTRPISLRLDEFTLQRAKQLANKRHVGYQTLLKEFIVERLYEEEKREGMVG